MYLSLNLIISSVDKRQLHRQQVIMGVVGEEGVILTNGNQLQQKIMKGRENNELEGKKIHTLNTIHLGLIWSSLLPQQANIYT